MFCLFYMCKIMNLNFFCIEKHKPIQVILFRNIKDTRFYLTKKANKDFSLLAIIPYLIIDYSTQPNWFPYSISP